MNKTNKPGGNISNPENIHKYILNNILKQFNFCLQYGCNYWDTGRTAGTAHKFRTRCPISVFHLLLRTVVTIELGSWAGKCVNLEVFCFWVILVYLLCFMLLFQPWSYFPFCRPIRNDLTALGSVMALLLVVLQE